VALAADRRDDRPDAQRLPGRRAVHDGRAVGPPAPLAAGSQRGARHDRRGLAQDLGLPIRGQEPQPRPRARGRFSWDAHVKHVLLGLLYGHYFFEQVGEIVDGQWRLRKLAPRPPRTIDEIRISETGGLAGIVQPYPDRRNNEPRTLIPVDRLVAYVWDQEGSAWRGRSMLRSLYRDYDIKDRLIKVDALKHQRNGMGVPLPHTTDQSVGKGAQAEALRMATALRAGEDAGGVMPYGIDMRIKGVDGASPTRSHPPVRRGDGPPLAGDVRDARPDRDRVRALGSEFLDFFDLGLETIALWIADTTTDHVNEDWVDFNYGPASSSSRRSSASRPRAPRRRSAASSTRCRRAR
jgi:hypothetical protein